MKKIILASLIALGLVACGSKEEVNAPPAVEPLPEDQVPPPPRPCQYSPCEGDDLTAPVDSTEDKK
jgi:hypothetical protein